MPKVHRDTIRDDLDVRVLVWARAAVPLEGQELVCDAEEEAVSNDVDERRDSVVFREREVDQLLKDGVVDSWSLRSHSEPAKPSHKRAPQRAERVCVEAKELVSESQVGEVSAERDRYVIERGTSKRPRSAGSAGESRWKARTKRNQSDHPER